MTTEEYYTTPPQEIFDEIQKAAIEIWLEYDDTHGYATEKMERVALITNNQDNAWYIVAMFDASNQFKLLQKLSPQAHKLVVSAMAT